MYNLPQTIIQGLAGLNNTGSSKRIAAAIIVGCVAIIDLCFAYSYTHSSNLSEKEITSIHTLIVNQLEYVLSANFIAAASYLGITYFDKKLDTKKEVELKKAETEVK